MFSSFCLSFQSDKTNTLASSQFYKNNAKRILFQQFSNFFQSFCKLVIWMICTAKKIIWIVFICIQILIKQNPNRLKWWVLARFDSKSTISKVNPEVYMYVSWVLPVLAELRRLCLGRCCPSDRRAACAAGQARRRGPVGRTVARASPAISPRARNIAGAWCAGNVEPLCALRIHRCR